MRAAETTERKFMTFTEHIMLVTVLLSHLCIQVAVKVIDKKKAREDAYVCRNMRRESRLLQQIRHRHIIKLFEVSITTRKQT